MATLNQIEAARRNGTRSRGPVTEEGKARSRYNSTKHGIYAKCVVLNNEDPDAWAESVEQSIAAWNPADDRELRLVTDIANANWRIDRLSAYEVAALDFEIDRMRPEVDATFEQIDEITRSTLAFNSLLVNNKALQTVQAALRTQYRLRDRATILLMRMQKERKACEQLDQQPPVPAPETASNTPEPAQAEPAANVINIENRRSEPTTTASPEATTGNNGAAAHKSETADIPETRAS